MRFDGNRTADDIACVGWILTAIQERVNERDLPHWAKLCKIVNASMKMLPIGVERSSIVSIDLCNLGLRTVSRFSEVSFEKS